MALSIGGAPGLALLTAITMPAGGMLFFSIFWRF
jgi:hypothetical protein